jgi:hypothetical protein
LKVKYTVHKRKTSRGRYEVMKKITTAFITISLMALFLGACGNVESGNDKTGEEAGD